MGMGFLTQFVQNLCNRLHDRIGLAEHLVVPEPQHTEPALRERFVSPGVTLRTHVLAAVDLDHELVLEADEVKYETEVGMLAPKLRAQLFSTQPLPKNPLGVGWLFAQ